MTEQPKVTASLDVQAELLETMKKALPLLDERNGGESGGPPKSFWIERALALIAAIIFGLAGWVWHTDRTVQHIEDVMYPTSAANNIAQNQVRIIQQLSEIQRRLQRIEDAR